VTVAAMLYQVDRVAAARGIDPSAVRALVEQHIEAPAFGFLGQRRVNVLAVNLALDAY
jgi:K+-transporting ATPase ATPase C chain